MRQQHFFQQQQQQQQQQQEPYPSSQQQQQQQSWNSSGGFSAMQLLAECGLLNLNALNQLSPRQRQQIEQKCIVSQQQSMFSSQVQSIHDFYQQINRPAFNPSNYHLYPSLNYQAQKRNLPYQVSQIPEVGQKDIDNYLQQQQLLADQQGMQQIEDVNYSERRTILDQQQQQQQDYQQLKQQELQQRNQQLIQQSEVIRDQFHSPHEDIPPVRKKLQFQHDSDNNSSRDFRDQQQEQLNIDLESQILLFSQLRQDQQQQFAQFVLRQQQHDQMNSKPNNDVAGNDTNEQISEKQDQKRQLLWHGRKIPLDYDEIFNLSSSLNSETLKNQQQFQESAYDKVKIETKYHQENVMKQSKEQPSNRNNHWVQKNMQQDDAENKFYEEKNQESQMLGNTDQAKKVLNFDERPIQSRGVNKEFEELVDEILNQEGDQKNFSASAITNEKKKSEIIPVFDARNLRESPLRFLKQGEGQGGKTSSVLGHHRKQSGENSKSPHSHSRGRQHLKDEDSNQRENEELLQIEALLKNVDSRKDELNLQKVMGENVNEDFSARNKIQERIPLEDIVMDEKTQRAIASKYAKRRLQEIDHLAKQLRHAFQKATIFKSAYENHLKVLQEKTQKLEISKRDFEDEKIEQKRLLQGKYRLLNKLQAEKSSNNQNPEKNRSATVETKSVLRYKEENKELKEKYEKLKVDQKKRIEEQSLTLSNMAKENKQLRDTVKYLQSQLPPYVKGFAADQPEITGEMNKVVNNEEQLKKQEGEGNADKDMLAESPERNQNDKNIIEKTKEDISKDSDKKNNLNRSHNEDINNPLPPGSRRNSSASDNIEIIGIPRTEKEWKKKIKRQREQQRLMEEALLAAEEALKSEKEADEDVSIIIHKGKNQSKNKNANLNINIKGMQDKRNEDSSFEKGDNTQSMPVTDRSIMTSASRMAAQNQLSKKKKQLGKIVAKVDTRISRRKSIKGDKQNISDVTPNSQLRSGNVSSRTIPRIDPSINSIKSVSKIDDNVSKVSSRRSDKSVRKLPLSLYKMIKNFSLEDIGNKIDVSELKYTTNSHYQKYLQAVDSLGAPKLSEREKDGTFTCIFESDIKKTVYKDNTCGYLFPSRYQIVFFTNGDIKQILPNGIEHYYFQSNQSTQTTLPEGHQIVLFSNGQVEFTMPDGEKQIRFIDGMVKITKKSGEEKIVYPSGAIEIVDQRFVKTIISPEGNKTILYPDSLPGQKDLP